MWSNFSFTFARNSALEHSALRSSTSSLYICRFQNKTANQSWLLFMTWLACTLRQIIPYEGCGLHPMKGVACLLSKTWPTLCKRCATKGKDSIIWRVCLARIRGGRPTPLKKGVWPATSEGCTLNPTKGLSNTQKACTLRRVCLASCSTIDYLTMIFSNVSANAEVIELYLQSVSVDFFKLSPWVVKGLKK